MEAEKIEDNTDDVFLQKKTHTHTQNISRLIQIFFLKRPYKKKRGVIIMHSEEGLGPFKAKGEIVKATNREIEWLEKY